MAFFSRSQRLFQTYALWKPALFKPRDSDQFKFVRFLATQGFFHPEKLYLDTFDRRTTEIQNNYGKISTEYKKKIMDQIDDQSTDLLFQDFGTYLHLLNSDDIQNCVKLLHKFDTQVERDREAGFVYDKSLAPTILRKCHVLNAVDVALEVYTNLKSGVGYLKCLMLIMDLLFKNKRYKACAEIVVEVIDGNKLDNVFAWFYELGILSAFKMNSPTGLNYAAKIFDALKNDPNCDKVANVVIPRTQLLIAYYCAQQNYVNAAISLVDTLDRKLDRRSQNIKVWAYLASDNVQGAVSLLRTFARNLQRDSEDVNKRDTDVTEGSDENKVQVLKDPFMYKDVFFKLRNSIKKSGNDDHRRYLQYISHNFDKIVMDSVLIGSIQGGTVTHYRRPPQLPAVKASIAPMPNHIEEDAPAVDENMEEEVAEEGTAV